MEIKKYLFKEAVDTVISRKNIRKIAVRQLDKILYKGFINSPWIVWSSMKLRRYEFMSSILHTVSQNLDKGNIKPEWIGSGSTINGRS